MIIENQAMVTDAVIEAVSRTEDPRLREILQALVRHLHGFVREISLTEREFQEAVTIVVAIAYSPAGPILGNFISATWHTFAYWFTGLFK